MKAGPHNSITDISGLAVGNAQDETLKSGVTVLRCEAAFKASVAIHGGGPGTRDTELLRPENTVEGVDAIVLSGGSAFGLDAASGVQAWMRENDRGFAVGPVRVPIVPTAILFDLINGGQKDWGRYPPYRDLGFEAANSACVDFSTGSVGAGTGALVANLKGGLGTASSVSENGLTCGALFAVNAVGNPTIGSSRHFHAAIFEKQSEFGGHGLPAEPIKDADQLQLKFRTQSEPGTNTTIGIVATDADLSKSQLRRLAIAAHDGIARAIWPAHTPMDGDLVFAVSTGCSEVPTSDSAFMDLCALGASTAARAISRGVYDATQAEKDLFPVYKEKFGP
ncbi:MAG: P1 family peptidase [Pseudomonadota bacterium]